MLFDEGHRDYHLASDHTAAINSLNSEGVTTIVSSGMITDSLLQNYDVLYINEPRTSFTSAEQSAVYNFVMNGGGLFIAHDFNTAISNFLLDSFDLNINDYSSPPGAVPGVDLLITDLEPHPITTGLAGFYWNYGNALNIGSAEWTVIARYNSSPLLAAREAGSGRIVVIGDNDLFVDSYNVPPENVKLYTNIVLWLCGDPCEPPVADAGVDQTINKGDTVQFDASASYDPDGTIVSYEWDFGDGSPIGTGVNPTHIYHAPGNYTVTLTVTDDDGATDTDTCTITVLLVIQPPVADAGEDQTVNEGTPLFFDGSNSTGSQRFSSSLFGLKKRIPDAELISQELPSITMDKNGIIYASWTDFRESYAADIYFTKSIDENLSFGNNIMVNDELSYSMQGFSSIAVGENGYIYIAWVDDRSGRNIYFSRSLDGGSTFEGDQKISDVYYPGIPWTDIAVSGSNVYVVWIGATTMDNDIYFVKSSDYGISFGEPIRVNDDLYSPMYTHQQSPKLAVDSMGNPLIVWVDSRDDNIPDIYFARSNNQGESFQPNIKVDPFLDEYIPQFSPSIAVDSEDTIYVVWTDSREGNWTKDEWNLFLAKSINGGISFETSTRIDDEKSNITTTPISIAADENNVYVAWIDRREDNYDVYFAMSTDKGSIFGKNIRVNEEDFGQRNQGYPDIEVHQEKVYVAWWDKMAAGPPFQTIYIASAEMKADSYPIVSYEWDFESDGIYDYKETKDNSPDGAFDGKTTHVYGDDGVFEGTLRIVDEQNLTDTDSCIVTVFNVNPTVTIKSAIMDVEIGLRVAGRKYNNVSMILYEEGKEIGQVSIERLPGSPNAQMKWIPYILDMTKTYSATVTYEPEDPPNIGGNPVWIYIKSQNGSIKKIHHTFNVQQWI
jgi:PKD repeat protein